jgi:hypothetical protein
LVGVAADEDDDGNAASGRGTPEPAKARKAEREGERETKAGPANTTEDAAKKLLTTRTRRAWELAQKLGMDEAEAFRAWAKGVLGVDKSSKDWSADEVGKLEDALHAMAANTKAQEEAH